MMNDIELTWIPQEEEDEDYNPASMPPLPISPTEFFWLDSEQNEREEELSCYTELPMWATKLCHVKGLKVAVISSKCGFPSI